MLVPLAFHPFSYWLRSKLAETREMACDARVSGQILPATDYARCLLDVAAALRDSASPLPALGISERDRKSTRLNSSHGYISYAVFCLKKKKKNTLALIIYLSLHVVAGIHGISTSFQSRFNHLII